MARFACYIPEILMTKVIEADNREEAEARLEDEYGLLVVCEETHAEVSEG